MKGFVDLAHSGLFLVVAWLAVPAHAQTPSISLQASGNYTVPVASLKGIRFRNTVHQQFDFSCGSAALATLLTHHYGHRVSEQDVFKEMYEHGDQAKIAKEGFSLLDIKNYLAARGFDSDGYVAEIEQLAEAGLPAIALIQENGYHHFVVIKGLRNGRVLLGDPSAGTRTLPYARFKKMWVNSILFVVRNRQELAKFNNDADWRSAPSAPINNALYRDGLNGLLPKRGPGDF
jgi:uncharacterized protein